MALPHNTTHHQVTALLHEAATLVQQAQRLAQRTRISLWHNPALATVMLNDLGSLQASAMAYTTQLELLLAALPAADPALQARTHNWHSTDTSS
jgi:hypothetical protein